MGKTDLAKLLDGRMRLTAEETADLASKAGGLSIPALLEALLKPVSELAECPISGFRVGALALGRSGSLYCGVNLEFPGLPLSQAVHAEQCALTSAHLAGEEAVVAVSVNEAPCGHCRQFMNELRDAGDLRISAGGRPARTLADLLPARFGPEDLLPGDGPRLLGAPPLELRLVDGGAAAGLGLVASAALAAASRSYAPYTRCPSGVALGVPSGAGSPPEVYAGSYLESAAYNPSLPPLQAAAIAAKVSGGFGALRGATECVLVELRGAAVEQADVLRAALAKVAPRASLTVLQAELVRR